MKLKMTRSFESSTCNSASCADAVETKNPQKMVVDPESFLDLKPIEGLPPHEANWFASIRANKQPNAGIELAVRVQSVISLAEMSDRLKVACMFDEKTRKVTNGEGKELPLLTYGSTPLS